MNAQKGKRKVCDRGHTFYKSSDCPTCPTCEAERAPKEGFLSTLSAPARRALEHEGITTLEKLATFTESEVLELHGMGPSTIPKLRKALKSAGLSFERK